MDEMEQLEMEQLEYIRRNQMEFNVDDGNDMFPNATKTGSQKQVVLSPEQEMKIISELKKSMEVPDQPQKKRKFNIEVYMSILSNSFMGIMDDLFNFDGDMEKFSDIFFKEDRAVFLATILFGISVGILYSQKK